MAKAQGKAKTERKPVTLAVETVEYLEQLASKGTHGTDVPSIMRRMVEDGVKQAILEGFIKLRE